MEKLPLENEMQSTILVLHQVPLQPAHHHIEHGEVSSLDKGEVVAGEEVRDVEGCGRAGHPSP